jgi:transposase IS66-like protein/transposase IS166 family protein/transposase IS66 family protein
VALDDSLPTDLASAHALIIAQRQALNAAEIRAAAAESEAQYRALLIEKLKVTIRRLRHERFGQSSERATLLDQLELQLADLEADAAQADTTARIVAVAVQAFERRRPARRPLPEHLPRERIVYPAPSACPCCGGTALRKIGEDVTETLELIPRQWKVIQHVREKFSCRTCEAKRWTALIRFLADGRLCMTNNAAERDLRAVAVGRKNWTFAGSDEGGRRAAALYTLIATTNLNDVDPQAWLADLLARLPDHPARRIGELLPWQWCGSRKLAA